VNIQNYNTVPLAYGVHVAASESRKALTVDLPTRRPHIEWHTNDDGEYQLWLQADSRAEGRGPTKLIARRTLLNEKSTEYSLRLIDPLLPHALAVSARHSAFAGAECGPDVASPAEWRNCQGSRTQFVLTYSADEANRMTIDIEWMRGTGQPGVAMNDHFAVTAAHPVRTLCFFSELGILLVAALSSTMVLHATYTSRPIHC
jgi:hypothetical protein